MINNNKKIKSTILMKIFIFNIIIILIAIIEFFK